MVLLLPPALVLALIFSAAYVIPCTGNPNQMHIYFLSLFSCAIMMFPPPPIGINTCVPRNFGHGSVVCECNSTYCDSVGPIRLPPLGQYSTYLSSRDGNRMEPGQGLIQANSTGAGKRGEVKDDEVSLLLSLISFLLPALRLTIVPYQKYQRIRGFGGAMTDAAAINMLSLSAGAREQLLRQYFSKEGRDYRLFKEMNYIKNRQS